jgi:hypothetical protein
LWVIFGQRVHQLNKAFVERIASIRPGHLAGLLLVLTALIVYDDAPTGTVHYLALNGLSPRSYGLILALCGSALMAAPHEWFTPLLVTPLTYYILMTWLFVIGQPPDSRELVGPLLQSAALLFVVISIMRDGPPPKLPAFGALP